GIVDPESFTQTYDEYIAKLSTGRVLGMIDQWWNFAYTAGDAIKQAKLDEQGCSYIPVPVTINENVKNQWHTSGGLLNVSGGLAVTVSCEDVEGALEFVNNMLTEEIQVLRYWGVEGTDYNVDDKGMFTRTEEQRVQAADTAYKASHLCTYSYFPQWDGTLDDGINATKSEAQPSEFYDSLGKDVKKAFDAYGIKTYVEMLGTNEKPGPWYPMWSFGQTLTSQTPGGVANVKITDVKDQYLPRLIMSDDYEGSWNEYMVAYNASNPQDYLDELQTELDKRVKDAAKYK
ncbi:MAG TPA: sugar ABC transporter substrate-binding protein, partial [Lachnospiraceae bacterium]